MTRPSVHRPLVFAASASAALVLAACGGGSTTSAASSAAPSSSAAATSAAPASSPAPAGKPLRIGFLPPTLGIPAFKGLADGLGAAGKATGDTLVSAEAKNDPTTQLQTIQQWVKLGQVDALWVIPAAPKTIAPALTEATAKGIVVIAGGKASDYGIAAGAPGITFSDIDNTAFGKGVGDLMAKCVTQRLGGTSKVLYVGPSLAAESTKNIDDSSKAALAAGAPGASVVQALVAKADQVSTQQMVASALQAHPDANGFMAGDAQSTMAGLAAFTAAGKDPSKLCVVGNGGTSDQTQAVDAGKLFGVVAFDFLGDLQQNLGKLHTMAGDPKAAGTQLTVPIKTIGGGA